MMNRLMILAAATSMVGVGELTHEFFVDPPVNLQASTPGVVQSGNINVSGAILGGTIFGQSGGTTTKVVSGWATSPTGFVFGGDFRSASTDGRGVFGSATATSGSTFGGDFRSASNAGRGVFGYATSASGTTYGVYGKAASQAGYGVYCEGNMRASGIIFGNGGGLTNLNIPAPLIIYGNVPTRVILGSNASVALGASGVTGEATGSSGTTFGVLGQSVSTNGRGVYGFAGAASGTTYGVVGQCNSPTGYGVYGEASKFGVNGTATASSGLVYGVLGQAGVNGYAVYATGDSGASGTKSFRIDHPFDPENKYLLHYSTESPSPQNFYSGNVTTDAKGYAWVDLPDYFQEINANFKYQLTVLGKTFAQAVVWEKIKGTQFQVRTNAPNVEVSWRVEADRNDLYCQRKHPKDVVDKDGSEKGTYQQPELYGLGPERGMNFNAERANQERSTHPPLRK